MLTYNKLRKLSSAPVDLFLMEAVPDSKDYAGFLSGYNANISIAFIKSRMRK